MLTATRECSGTDFTEHTHEQFSSLPGKMQRSQVADCLRELAGPLWDMKSGTLMTLLAMIDKTRPQDWVQSVSEPLCYARQLQTAMSVGKTERQVRRDEQLFVRLGLVEDRTGANGARSRSGGLGMAFTPLIKMMPRLLAFRAELRRDKKEKEALVYRRSHHKKLVQRAIGDLQALTTDLPDAIAAFEELRSWPEPQALRRMTLEAVITHCEAVKCLVDNLLDLLAKQTEMSGRTVTDVRHYIQDTTQEESMYCNATPQIMTDATSDLNLRTNDPNGPSEGLEKKYEAAREQHKDKFAQKLTPKRLYHLCAFDMKMHLDLILKGRNTILHHDFINAAYDCAGALGVNHSAWVEAIDAMGEFQAALCIILIDANRDHPVTPIRSPGGALRAMTRKHQTGHLNIFGGLIGLNSRITT